MAQRSAADLGIALNGLEQAKVQEYRTRQSRPPYEKMSSENCKEGAGYDNSGERLDRKPNTEPPGIYNRRATAPRPRSGSGKWASASWD